MCSKGNVCPYCGTPNYVPDYVASNIEHYGSSRIRFGCAECKKIIEASGTRRVIIRYPRKTNEPSDW
jgi:hypothetical protein